VIISVGLVYFSKPEAQKEEPTFSGDLVAIAKVSHLETNPMLL